MGLMIAFIASLSSCACRSSVGELGTAARAGERHRVRSRYRDVGDVPSGALFADVGGADDLEDGFEGGTPIAMVPWPACVACIPWPEWTP